MYKQEAHEIAEELKKWKSRKYPLITAIITLANQVEELKKQIEKCAQREKEILGDRVCIRGGVPITLLCTATPDEVRTYCKKLIEVVGKDGGFIMASGVSFDDAKAENVRAMIDVTREYGAYN